MKDRKYNILYVDPPWDYDDKCHAGHRGATYKYKIINAETIKRLPVANIVAEDAVLFLWATFPMLPEAMEVIKAWGFKYKTIGFLWVKTNKIKPTLFWGMGNWTRSNAEPCLLAVKGNLKRVSKAVHSVIVEQPRRHSEKPSVVRDKIVELVGDLPRIELFSRHQTLGWDVWGNEVENNKNLFEGWNGL